MSEARIGRRIGTYLVTDVLGAGGMGVVYRARDELLERDVAIKVLSQDSQADPTGWSRLLREARSAAALNHPHVCTIYEVGESEGESYLAMEFIVGQALTEVIPSGGLSEDDVLRYASQIVDAVAHAHERGIVHRDLKPANVLVTRERRAKVLDFGLAKRVHAPSDATTHFSISLAEANTVTGTLPYMAPELFRGQDADARSDVWAIGVILCEMSTGHRPFEGQTAFELSAEILNKSPAGPDDVSVGLKAIIDRCLEKHPDQRFGSAVEVRSALGALDAPQAPGSVAHRRITWPSGYRRWIGAAMIMLFVVAGAYLAGVLRPGASSRAVNPTRSSAPLPISILVADFVNSTGDSFFDGSLESTAVTSLEEAPFINAFNRGQARNLLKRLQNAATRLDEAAARLIALREGIGVILTGAVSRQGSGYKVSVKAVDAATGKLIASKEESAPRNEQVLRSLGRTVAAIRTALGDATPEAAQLAAMETYTAGSLAAAHAYALAQENLASGKSDDAVRYYLQAVAVDPNLGRAYSGLAAVAFNLKKREEADGYFKKALALIDRMSEREKYRTLGAYHIFAGNSEQAVEAFRKLTSLFPGDSAGYTNLSTAYVRLGKMQESIEPSRRAVEITPSNLLRRYNYAIHSMFAGDFSTATAEAERILEKDPQYESAYLTLALSALFQSDDAKALEMYRRLEGVSPLGASLGRMGRADLEMYRGRYAAAVAILQEGADVDRRQGDSGELAYKLVALAEARAVLGRTAEAAAAATEALQASSDDGIAFLVARVLIDVGEAAKAQPLARDLESKLQKQSRSLGLMISAEIALSRKQLPAAFDKYREAQTLHDSWLSHFLLGRAYAQAQHFPEALSELETAERRASEATDLFDQDTTTLRYLPPLYYWLGRDREGLAAVDAARRSYQRYVAIRGRGDAADPFLADARGRAGS
jgi:serine/threonine protein kinase/tetratricopeptide (TPR) repeat protein